MRDIDKIDIIRRIEAFIDVIKNKDIVLDKSSCSMEIEYENTGKFLADIKIAGYDTAWHKLQEK